MLAIEPKRKSARTTARKVVAQKKIKVAKPEKPPKKSVATKGPAPKGKAKRVPGKRQSREAESEEIENGEELFCLCKTPYDPRRFMIGCDKCYGWFHARCVNITATEAHRIKQFVCPPCRRKGGSNKKEGEPSTKKTSGKRERPEESKPKVFPIARDMGVPREPLRGMKPVRKFSKRQKLKSRQNAQQGDIIVQLNSEDETDYSDSGASSTGLYVTSDESEQVCLQFYSIHTISIILREARARRSGSTFQANRFKRYYIASAPFVSVSAQICSSWGMWDSLVLFEASSSKHV